ncbi:glycosyltransferase [Candidatus Pacearchaeota archaeon]|nr:glycosyltransferase [Candidatus Pacearchaeota archaeon]
MKLSIIVPAHNEERRIQKTLELYTEFFDKLEKNNKIQYILLIVLNATKDNTLGIVKKFAGKNKHIIYLDLKSGGKGYAVIEGFKYSLNNLKSDLIGFVDADSATSPEAFYDLVKRINGFDGVIASRYIPGALMEPRPTLQRYFVSRMYNLLIRTLFFIPYRDTQCGAKLFKSKALQDVLPSFTMSHWAFDVDMLFHLRKKGYDIAEVPTIWSDRQYSTINFMKSGPLMALAIIRLRLLYSPFSGFVRVYDKITKIFR